MPTRLLLRDSQTEAGTGATVHDLGEDAGTSASHTVETNGFVEARRYQAPIPGLASTSVPTSVRVSAQGGSTEARYRLQRIGSDGETVLDSGPYSEVFSGVGVHTETLTLDTTWNAGDMLALSIEGNHSGGGGRSFEIAVGDADSYADAELVSAGTTESVAGTSAGTSSDSAGPSVQVAVAGTGAGTSLDSAAAALQAALAGTSAGTSQDTGAVQVTAVEALSGTSVGTSLDTADASVNITGSAVSAGTSTDSASVSLAVALAGTAGGTSSDSASANAPSARPPIPRKVVIMPRQGG